MAWWVGTRHFLRSLPTQTILWTYDSSILWLLSQWNKNHSDFSPCEFLHIQQLRSFLTSNSSLSVFRFDGWITQGVSSCMILKNIGGLLGFFLLNSVQKMLSRHPFSSKYGWPSSIHKKTVSQRSAAELQACNHDHLIAFKNSRIQTTIFMILGNMP